MNAVVLGIGNPLLGDDGFGVEVARQLKESRDLNAIWDGVEIVDGGSQGLYLLPYLQGRSHIIVADAIAFGGQPGETVKLNAADVPARLQIKMSEHQVGFNEVLALLQLMGETPTEFLFLGAQRENNEWAEPMTPEVAAAVAPVVEQITAQVKRWRQDNGTNECFAGAQ